MTTAAILRLDAPDPAPLSVRHPLGVDLDLTLLLRSGLDEIVDPTGLLLQLVLRARSKGGQAAYEVEVTDAANGGCAVTVPGDTLLDPAGYTVELYQRRANPDGPPQPVGMVAQGKIAMQGSAYATGPVLPP